MPEIVEMHTSIEFVERWVKYGLLDSELTFLLYHTMKLMMKSLPVKRFEMETTWDLYVKYWLPFGELLTDMERRGIYVNRAALEEAHRAALADVEKLQQRFSELIQELAPGCIEFSPTSAQQLQQLLFAPFKRKDLENLQKNGKGEKVSEEELKEIAGVRDGPLKLKKKVKKRAQFWEPDEESERQLDQMDAAEEAEEPEEDDPMKIARTLVKVDDFPEVRTFKVAKLPNFDYRTIGQTEQELKKKTRDMQVKGFGIPPLALSASGLPSVDLGVLKELAGGKIEAHFK